MKNQCKQCDILKKPRNYFDWILRENDDWIVGGTYFGNIECIYKKHGALPGGHKLNEMIDDLVPIMFKGEKLEYIDHEHFYILVRRKNNGK